MNYEEGEYSIAFGKTAVSMLRECRDILELPRYELLLDENNIAERTKASKGLKAFAYKILEDQEEKTEIKAEVGQKTVGKENSDVIITPKELDYAMKLKKLLPESKVVIKKSDLVIEAE
jgi:hypothetical protein